MCFGRRLVAVLTLVGCAGRTPPPASAPGATPDGASPAPPLPGLPPVQPRPRGPERDSFGVHMLYASAAGGLAWVARWNDLPRQFSGVDPHDPWFDAAHGDATYAVPGDGTLRISGPVPRMYIH